MPRAKINFKISGDRPHQIDMTSKLVKPGEPDTSRLLTHPLAPEAGGGAYHSGGRQFATKNDPEWKLLADWINGKKL